MKPTSWLKIIDMKMSLLTAYLGEGKEAKKNEMDKNFFFFKYSFHSLSWEFK